MDVNLDVTNYLKSIIPEWTSEASVTGHILSKIVGSVGKDLDKFTNQKNLEAKPVDVIFKIEKMIRVFNYIVDIAYLETNKNSGVHELNNLKNKEFTWYKNELKNIGITEEPKERDYHQQSLELIQLVKKYSKSMNMDLNQKDEYGRAPFLNACIDNNLDRIRILKLLGADTRSVDDEGNTSLHLVVDCAEDLDSQNKKEIIKFLLECDVDINAKNNDGDTSLIIALTEGHLECAKLFIGKDADLTITNDNKRTSLHIACSNGNKEIVELLLQKNFKLLDAKDSSDETPLFVAIVEGHLECVRLLIENCADISIDNNLKQTCLHGAAGYGYKEIAELLIQKNHALINRKDTNGNTSLHFACSNGHTEMAEFFVEKGADITMTNNHKITPIHAACISGNKEIVELLIERGPDLLNVQDGDGYSPFLSALNNGHEECAWVLIENGADVNIIGQNKKAPIHLAYEYGLLDLVLEIISKGGNPNAADSQGITPLYQAMVSQDIEGIKLLIQHGAEITDKPTKNGNSIFSILLRYSNIPLYKQYAEEFLRDNKKVDFCRADSFGNTVFHYICRHGIFNFLKYFNGVSAKHFYERNIYYETPFQLAFDKKLWEDYPEIMNNFLKSILNDYIHDEINIIEVIKKGGVVGFSQYLQDDIKNFLNNASYKKINPVYIAFLLNSPSLVRAIARELGQARFEHYLGKIPHETKQFEEFINYDLNYHHLAAKVAELPEKPDEKEYQVEALLDLFTEITGYNPENQQSSTTLEQKFRNFLPTKEIDSNTDRDIPIQELYKRLTFFIENCKNRTVIKGVEKGEEEAFWSIVERAVTNTIKSLSTPQESEEDLYVKKAQLMREYLSIVGYCGTRLDIEFGKLYHLNSGIVRSFKDQIYFLLSEQRREILESLVPRDDQSVHYIQSMLSELSDYNIPIRESPDHYSQKSEALDIKKTFESKYKDGLFVCIKDYLKSNDYIQDMFFQWLHENGRLEKKLLLSQKEISDCLKYITDHKGVLSNDAPFHANGLMKYLELMIGDDYKTELQIIQDEEFESVVKCLTDPVFLTQSDFEEIIRKGDCAFKSLDCRLQQAIRLSGFQDKLSETFKTEIPGRIFLTSKQEKEKKVILDKYREIYFPEMVKKVKDDDVKFLLEKFEILNKVSLLPQPVRVNRCLFS